MPPRYYGSDHDYQWNHYYHYDDPEMYVEGYRNYYRLRSNFMMLGLLAVLVLIVIGLAFWG